jgi:HIV Tat-specific factor 1
VDLRKRKATDGEAEVCNTRLVSESTAKPVQSNTKKQKADQPREERKNTAIYVTSLPLDVTEDEIYDTFSKYGVIAESADTDQPRIKLYADDKGNFKGDALIGEEVLRHA